jgi:hypothetical protein
MIYQTTCLIPQTGSGSQSRSNVNFASFSIGDDGKPKIEAISCYIAQPLIVYSPCCSSGLKGRQANTKHPAVGRADPIVPVIYPAGNISSMILALPSCVVFICGWLWLANLAGIGPTYGWINAVKYVRTMFRWLWRD